MFSRQQKEQTNSSKVDLQEFSDAVLTEAFLIEAFKRHQNHLFAHSSMPSWLKHAHERAIYQIRSSAQTDTLAHMLRGLEDFLNRSEEPFEVFIVGEGKFGKSTLINALMGQVVAPVDRLPKTWCFNRFIATDVPSELVRVFVDPSLISDSFVHQVGRWLINKSPHKSRGLDEYFITSSDAQKVIQYEEERFRKNLESGSMSFSPIMEIEWEVSAKKCLLPGLRLVDTQGIDQIHADHEHRNYLKWQYERADAVIWIVSQERIGTNETKSELEKAQRYAKPIILVLNKWDKIRGDSTRQLERAHLLYSDYVRDIVPLSALEAFLSTNPEGYEFSPQDERLLQFRGLRDWQQLRKVSGIDLLLDTFQNIIGDRNFIRNQQTYSALRQKQREWRSIIKICREEATTNINLYNSLKTLIKELHRGGQLYCDDSFRKSLTEAKQDTIHNLEKVNWNNRHECKGILGLDLSSEHIKEASRQAQRHLENNVNQIIAKHQRDHDYAMSEFDSDGTVAYTFQVTQIKTFDDLPKRSLPNWNINISYDSWWDVKNFFANIINPSWMDQENRKLREQISEQVIKQIQDFVYSEQHAVNNWLDHAITRLDNDADQQINSIGGVLNLQEKIVNINHALIELAVPPVFTFSAMQSMKRSKWMRLLPYHLSK